MAHEQDHTKKDSDSGKWGSRDGHLKREYIYGDVLATPRERQTATLQDRAWRVTLTTREKGEAKNTW